MTLNSIAELSQPQEHLDWYLDQAKNLSQVYFDHVANDQDQSYWYKVEVFGGKERSPGIHASEISKCLRQPVYSLLGAQRKADAEVADVNMLMRFRLGTAIHAMVQNDWHRIADKSEGRLHFADEVTIKPALGGISQYWGLHSSCDGVITFLYEGQPYLRVGVEIKSESDKQFEKRRQPQDDHMEQTTLYMAALDLPLMWVFYYNKSNSNITSSYPPYLYQFNRRLWEDTLQPRFRQMHDFAARQELPERTEGMYCKWCPYSWACQPPSLKPQAAKKVVLTQAMRRTR